jgi:hypothetical protein
MLIATIYIQSHKDGEDFKRGDSIEYDLRKEGPWTLTHRGQNKFIKCWPTEPSISEARETAMQHWLAHTG